LVWAAAIWFSVVYLAHHYVIDVVAGIGFAIGAYVALQSPILKRFAAWLAGLGRRRIGSVTAAN
jgi:membrane-associated phospholipid phosphatase